MSTCFLFAHQLDDENGLSLRLDDAGLVDAPLMLRTHAEIRVLQQGVRTIVVLPGELASLHMVDLPRLSSAKVRAALPFVLEEQVAQNIAQLHFAFSRSNTGYLVAAVDKTLIHDLINRLKRVNLSFSGITLDWFALKPGEACLTPTNLLVNDNSFRGALSLELTSFYFERQTNYAHIVAFPDSALIQHAAQFTPLSINTYVWLAKRLYAQPWINLCQGEFQLAEHDGPKRWLLASSLFLGLWLLSWVGYKAFILPRIGQQIQQVDSEIGIIYRQFFPGAKQVISPQFRVSQLLNYATNGATQQTWNIIGQVGRSFFGQTACTLKQYRFQHKQLNLSLVCNDFASLEQLKKRLQVPPIKVRQLEAQTQAQQVIASLEISL